MFSWHETTRRRACRLLFCALAVLPTCAVLAAAGWVRHPQTTEWARRRLADELAWNVTLARVSYPRPQGVLYEELELVDPESGQLLAKVRSLAVQCTGSKTIVTAGQLELNGARLEAFWELFERALRRQPSGTLVELRAKELTVHGSAGAQTFNDVEGLIEPAGSGPQASLSFRLSGGGAAKPGRLAIYRNRQRHPPATAFELHSGSRPLPAALLASHWPALETLGAKAEFSGTAWATRDPSGWSGELSGALTGVELDRLVSQHFGQKLSGAAEIKLERVRFHQGRLVDAAGSVAAGPGLVSRSLMAAAVAQLHLVPAVEFKSVGEQLAYEQLALSFRLATHGIELEGQCPAHNGGVVVGRHGLILNEPLANPQPLSGLVRMLVRPGEEALPVTPELEALVGVLPITSGKHGAAQARTPLGPTNR